MKGDALDTWHWRNPSPQGNSLWSVTYGAGQFVAAGERAAIIRSKDGLNWTALNLEDNNRLRVVTYGAGRFLAIGTEAWVSTDVITWSRSGPFPEPPSSVPFPPVPPPANFANDVIHTGSEFIAVGGLARIAASPDGLNWQRRVSQTSSAGLNAIAQGNGRIVAVGGYGTNSLIRTSADGTNWTSQTASHGVLATIAFGDGVFIAVGVQGSFSLVFLISSNGLDWTPLGLPQSGFLPKVYFLNGKFFVLKSNIIFILSQTEEGWVLDPQGFSGISALAASQEVHVGVGAGGYLASSLDGENWVSRTTAHHSVMTGMAEGKGLLIATTSSGEVLQSETGATWTMHPKDADVTTFSDVLFTGEEFLAVGTHESVGVVFRSQDGADWQRQVAGLERYEYLNDVAFAEGTSLAVGSHGFTHEGFAVRFRSPDASTIVKRHPATMFGVAHGNGLWVCVGAKGLIWTSPNAGDSWEEQSSGVTNDLVVLDYVGGLFITADSYGSILTSADGISWSKNQLTSPFFSPGGTAFGASKYVIVGSGELFVSDDAVPWSRRELPTTLSSSDVFFAKDSFFVLTSFGGLLQSGYAGPPLLRFRKWGGPLELSLTSEYGQPIQLQVSSDLHDWQNWLSFQNENGEGHSIEITPGEPHRFFRALVSEP